MKTKDFSPPTSADFLHELKEKYNADSYYQLAQTLEISQSRMSMYRTGKREFDVVTCVAVASLLGHRLDYVLASVAANRAKRKDEREVWQFVAHQAKKASAAAVAVFAMLTGVSVPSPAEAAAALLCILCKVGRVSRPTPVSA